MADDAHRNDATPQEIWSILRELSTSQRETDRRMQETDGLIRETRQALRESGIETDRRMQETGRLIRETRQALKESGIETDRRMQETDRHMQETDRRMQETDRHMQETDRRMQETDRRMQETDRRLHGTDRRLRSLDELFNGQWGKLIEALVKGDLVRLLNRRDIEVHHVSANLERNYADRTWEIDLLAVNSDELVAVEVKTTLKVRDVDHFLDTLRTFTRLMPEYATRTVYGAVAYLKVDEAADKYAERQGLFVIRATGSSASVTNREDFRPRTFGRGEAHA